MKLLPAALALAAASAFALPVLAADDHKIVAPNEVKWSPAPPSVPKGAEVAVLYGDPSKDGPFAMRLKMPKGYAIPPHSHPKPEIVTVISGTFQMNLLWLPLFIAWMLKGLILRFGGRGGYLRCMPFFFGLILGQSVVGAFWSLASVWTGERMYSFWGY